GLPGKEKYAEVATKTIPEPATCTRRCVAGGLVCTTIRRTVAGDAFADLLYNLLLPLNLPGIHRQNN
ncbi:hypothetical protein, partial [Cronobacter malonaticus]|uniref:hypothetical protein n=1 Tax=Cronobacter malonaticus TaxID=413503 RepID=UPI001F1D3342